MYFKLLESPGIL